MIFLIFNNHFSQKYMQQLEIIMDENGQPFCDILERLIKVKRCRHNLIQLNKMKEQFKDFVVEYVPTFGILWIYSVSLSSLHYELCYEPFVQPAYSFLISSAEYL